MYQTFGVESLVWFTENWGILTPMIISIVAIVVSLLSYFNSKRTRILSNQPKLEINHIFDDSLKSVGYMLISIKNLNNEPFQAVKVKVDKHNFKIEYENGQFSRGGGTRDNSFIIYVYMNSNSDLDNKLIITYEDFEGKKHRAISEKIKMKKGKLENNMSGSKFILK